MSYFEGFGIKLRSLLEKVLFFVPKIFLEVSNPELLGVNVLGTLGDALSLGLTLGAKGLLHGGAAMGACLPRRCWCRGEAFDPPRCRRRGLLLRPLL